MKTIISCDPRYQAAVAESGWEMKDEKGGGEEEDGEGPGGITDPDYAHSISPSERESVGPNGPIQPPLAWGRTALRSSQDTGTFPPETFNMWNIRTSSEALCTTNNMMYMHSIVTQ